MWNKESSENYGNSLKNNNKIISGLIIALILGSALRFYGLEIQSLWGDEFATYIFSKQDSIPKMIENMRPDPHPPGYQIVIYFIVKYLGDSEFLLRLPSAVCGVLSIFIIYILGARIYTKKEGLIASFMMAILWCPIFYSQEARSYSILLLFTSAASYFWIGILDNLRKETVTSYYSMFGYISTAVISSYIHYFGLYLIFLQGICSFSFFIRKKKSLFNIILIYLIILIAYSPWLPVFFKHLHTRRLGWVKTPDITAFGYFLGFLFNKSMMVLIIALTLYGHLFYRTVYVPISKKKTLKLSDVVSSPDFLLIMWLIIPFAVVFIKSLVSKPVLIYRSLIISLPPAYLLFARSITKLPFRPKRQVIVTIFILCLFLFDLLFSMRYYSVPNKFQYRHAVNYIAEEDNNNISGRSLIIGYDFNIDYFNYYFERINSDKRVKYRLGKKRHIQRLKNIIINDNPDYIWYIGAELTPDPDFIGYMCNNFTPLKNRKFVVDPSVVRVFTEKKVEVWLFKKS